MLRWMQQFDLSKVSPKFVIHPRNFIPNSSDVDAVLKPVSLQQNSWSLEKLSSNGPFSELVSKEAARMTKMNGATIVSEITESANSVLLIDTDFRDDEGKFMYASRR
jgi:hypothetical protein